MANIELVKAMEAEIERLTSEYKEVGADLMKNGYDFYKSNRVTRINYTISVFKTAISAYKKLNQTEA